MCRNAVLVVSGLVVNFFLSAVRDMSNQYCSCASGIWARVFFLTTVRDMSYHYCSCASGIWARVIFLPRYAICHITVLAGSGLLVSGLVVFVVSIHGMRCAVAQECIWAIAGVWLI